jgi:sucrose phosphorylase
MRLEALLNRWRYGEDRERIEFLTSQLLQFLQTSTNATNDASNNATTSDARWDGSTCVLITYGDAVQTPNEVSLATLRTLLDRHFGALANTVHVLPFLKASSDGGFAVASHEQLEEHLGGWEDLKALSQGRQLMADLVLNHVSAAHPWVQQFRQGQTPGVDCVLAPDPNEDWSQVVRPRSTNLFTPFQTQNGVQSVWTTFGPDQVDVNWDCDVVLLAYAALLNRMVAHGVGWLRLDAVGYVWKEAGSTCIHHPRAHLLVKLLRALLEGMEPQGVVVTETNVPERENLSYLTPGDEAHLAYNFPLPPLLLDAVLREKADLLNGWLQRWPSLPNATNLLNFSASHDGVGLRPLEGLMDQERLAQLLEQCELRGGLVSHRRLSDGRDQPYELNISWWAAMADAGRDPHHLQRERFLLSQLLVMALPGIPAFYLPTVLASGNDAATFRRSGHRRDLNRERFSAEALERQLTDPDSDASHNLRWLQHAMAVRAALPAFHPDAAMQCISERKSDRVILQRGCGASSLWAVHNVTAHRINLDLRILANRSQWCDRLRDQADIPTLLTLNPFAVHWLQPC